jgi:protein AroM
MTRCLGLLTIGQAPRTDVVPAMLPHVGPDVQLLQAGCLDGLDRDQIDALAPGPDDYVLTTRLADGTSVVIGRRPVEAILPRKVQELAARGAAAVALLCTGELSAAAAAAASAASGVPLLHPDRVLAQTVAAVLEPGATLGVLTPLPGQVEQTRGKWAPIVAGAPLLVEAATPYGPPEGVEEAARRLRSGAPSLVVMDCIGYLPSMKSVVRDTVGCPVVLANTMLARVLAELA